VAHQAHAPHTAAADSYRARRPDQAVLHRTLSAHFGEFRARADEQGGLPKFIVREVEVLALPPTRIRLCSAGMSRVGAQSARRVQLQTQRRLSELLWTAHERRSAALQSFPRAIAWSSSRCRRLGGIALGLASGELARRAESVLVVCR
jgi:hypothetical protein